MALPTKALSLISSFLSPTSSAPSHESIGQKDGGGLAGSSATKRDQKVRAIIFSKDRPGQLLACLSSAARQVKGVPEWTVIYATSNEISKLRYQKVFARCHLLEGMNNSLKAVYESTTRNFQQIFRTCLTDFPNEDLVWFQVDDAIHYRDLDLSKASTLLQSKYSILGVHTKLWKHANRCHPARNATMAVPALIEESNGFASFVRSKGTMDWNYPFDLSGGLYRVKDVVDLLNQAGPANLNNPNQLEFELNQQIASLGVLKPLSACLWSDVPAFSLVTINRVQSVFENAVFDSVYSKDPWGELTDALLNHDVDDGRYRKASGEYRAVHIGDLFVKPKLSCAEIDATVLIPCKNAEPTLARALRSVLSQDCGEYKVNVIVIDDASTDGSCLIAQSFGVRCCLRPKSLEGVAGALNFGLQFCDKSEFVIRMDADDEMLPGRIKAQLDAMKVNPAIGVLGTRAVVSRKQATSEAPTPLGPASIAWSMCFYCPIMHPSVCVRTQVLEAFDGYPTDQAMEDYTLWHRVVGQRRWLVDNLDFVGLVHYKSDSSVTSKWTAKDRDLESARIAFETVRTRSKTALKSLTAKDWLVVCHPDRYKAEGLGLADEICECLKELCESIVAEFEHVTSEGDLEWVKQDFIKRSIEMKAFAHAQ